MKINPLLLIRVDAGENIGWGHATRCLALAEAWKKSYGPFCFVMASPPPTLVEKIEKAGGEIHRLSASPGGAPDAVATLEVAKQKGAACVGLDGYHFKDVFYSAFAKCPVPTFLVDDLGSAHARAFGTVINFQLHANPKLYPDNPAGRLLLGPQYLLLREEFVSGVSRPPATPSGPLQVLLTFGASGKSTFVQKLGEALAKISSPALSLSALVPALPRGAPKGPITYLPQPTNLATFFAGYDLVISAMGTTIWELLRMGVPTVGVPLNAGHEIVGKSLQEQGLIRLSAPQGVDTVIRELASDLPQRKKLAERGRQFLDGLGAARATQKLYETL